MPIIRKQVGDYKRAKKSSSMQRQADDHDLAWGDHQVYILDEHEWFDPHTSTKYNDGVSRHAMYGPSVIHVTNGGGSMNTAEYHVNDPTVWAWIRRCIVEGYLTPETIAEGINTEREIKVA